MKAMMCAVLLLAACSPSKDNGETPDLGNEGADAAIDMPATGDVGLDVDPDVAGDQGGSDCVQVTPVIASVAVEYLDDVAVEYRIDLEPDIAGVARPLRLLFERYNDSQFIGTFELGTGSDDNFGTCTHCLYAQGNGPERAYFADAGTLVLGLNPYSRRLDAAVSGLRLVEVAVDPFTRESAPIGDGLCVEVADFEVAGVFPANGWLCPDEQYGDGAACHCNCGTYDPDCGGAIECLPGDPSCVPRDELPVENCAADEVCAFTPINATTVCTKTCDWVGRSACDTGTCVFDFGVGDGDLCLADGPRISTAMFDEACTPNGYQQLCNVVDGFALGYCGPDDICRLVCSDDAECIVAGETCRKFVVDGPLGYCGPEPTDG